MTDDSDGVVLCLLAEKALENGDCGRVEHYCRELIERNYEAGWKMCRLGALAEKCIRDVDSRLFLLNFAQKYCPASSLADLIYEGCYLKFLALCQANSLSPSNLEGQIADEMVNLTAALEKVLRENTDLTTVFDAIYCEEVEEKENSARHFLRGAYERLAVFLRAFCLKYGENLGSNVAILDKVLLQLSKSSIFCESASYSAGILMGLVENGQKLAVFSFDFGENLGILSLLAYVGAIRAMRKQKIDWNLEEIAKIRPAKLLEILQNVGFLQSCADLMDVLNKLERKCREDSVVEASEDIDVERFLGGDDEYKSETVLGMAMSADDVEYEKALKFAQQYDIPLFDVYFANLEFLMTDSGLKLAEVRNLVKKRRLMENLSKEQDKLADMLNVKVFPLLAGDEHDKLIFYFLILERFCRDKVKNDATHHRFVLRQLTKLMPCVDFKKLIMGKGFLQELISNHLTSKNVEPAAKLLTKIPGRDITVSEVYSIWCRKLFLERLTESGYIAAYNAIRNFLPNLDDDFFAAIVMSLIDETMESLSEADRQHLLELFHFFAEKRADSLPKSTKMLANMLPKKEKSQKTSVGLHQPTDFDNTDFEFPSSSSHLVQRRRPKVEKDM